MSRYFFENKVKNLLQNGFNILITGPKGSGKTYLLTKITKNYLTNPSLNSIELQQITRKKGTKTQQLTHLKNMTRTIIAIDDLQNLTENREKNVNNLTTHHTILGASKTRIELNNFINLEIPPMKEKELMNIIKDVKIGEREKSLLIKHAKNNPGRLIHLTNNYIITGRIKKRGQPPNINQVINIIMSVRYTFLMLRMFEIYALVSMLGYAMRAKKYQKK